MNSADARIPQFVVRVLEQGSEHYRDFPWRHTRDPYAILLSEVMLQQTQVGRVVGYWARWLEDFPTLDALAAAPLEAVLRAWQGLGYNRRAIALKRLAEQMAEQSAPEPASLPRDEAGLRALPGVGPATAAGVRAFAYGESAVYLETNVRSVVIHELFADSDQIADRAILPLLKQAAAHVELRGIDSRIWNYALLDYGAHLKRNLPNPSRRSAHHVRQSTFEGSTRQKRAKLLRLVMEMPGLTAEQAASELRMDVADTLELLEALSSDGFITQAEDTWRIS